MDFDYFLIRECKKSFLDLEDVLGCHSSLSKWFDWWFITIAFSFLSQPELGFFELFLSRIRGRREEMFLTILPWGNLKIRAGWGIFLVNFDLTMILKEISSVTLSWSQPDLYIADMKDHVASPKELSCWILFLLWSSSFCLLEESSYALEGYCHVIDITLKEFVCTKERYDTKVTIPEAWISQNICTIEGGKKDY